MRDYESNDVETAAYLAREADCYCDWQDIGYDRAVELGEPTTEAFYPEVLPDGYMIPFVPHCTVDSDDIPF